MFKIWRLANVFMVLLCLSATMEAFSQGITLDSLERLGMRSNPDLLLSEVEYEGTARDTLASTIRPNPYLEIDAGYNLHNPEKPKMGAKISREFQSGVRKQQYLLSQANLEAKRQWRKTRQLDITLEIRSSFFAWQILKRKSLLQREVQRRWESLNRIAATKVKEGRLSQVDEMQVRLNLAKARQRESVLKTEMNALEKSLAYLTGQASLPDTLAIIPMDISPNVPAVETLMELMIQESPELLSLDKEVVAQRNQASLERALSNPILTLSLGYERETEGDQIIGGGVALPLPLFNRNQAGLAKSQASLRLAERRRSMTELRLKVEIIELHGRLMDLAERYRNHRQEISALSQKQIDLSEMGFLQGLLGLFDLSRVQEEFLAQEEDALDILEEYYHQWNKLGKVLGGKIW